MFWWRRVAHPFKILINNKLTTSTDRCLAPLSVGSTCDSGVSFHEVSWFTGVRVGGVTRVGPKTWLPWTVRHRRRVTACNLCKKKEVRPLQTSRDTVFMENVLSMSLIWPSTCATIDDSDIAHLFYTKDQGHDTIMCQ